MSLQTSSHGSPKSILAVNHGRDSASPEVRTLHQRSQMLAELMHGLSALAALHLHMSNNCMVFCCQGSRLYILQHVFAILGVTFMTPVQPCPGCQLYWCRKVHASSKPYSIQSLVAQTLPKIQMNLGILKLVKSTSLPTSLVH